MNIKNGWKVLTKPIELEDGRRITSVGVPCGQISVELVQTVEVKRPGGRKEYIERAVTAPVNAVPGLSERLRSGIIDCGRRIRDGAGATPVMA